MVSYKSLKTKEKFSWVIPKVVAVTYGSGCLLDSISAALSCPVYVPPRKETSGEERGLLSQTAVGNRA